MESSDNSIDPENEVKKLQELVKKLERQNELLRSKQKVGSDGSLTNGAVEKTAATHTPGNQVPTHHSRDSLKHKVAEGGLEDVDVLDVDNLSLKDEDDSWLYSSPKPLTPQQTNINVYKWVRQDFDHPSPELESAKRSLLSKLDEVARINRSCSTPALGSTMPPAKSVSPLSRSTEDSHKYYSHHTEHSPRHSPSPHHRHSMLAATGSRLENGTYTRRKKPEEQHGPVLGEKEKGEEGAYQLPEGTDVEKLARQQEESLRQSIATYTSPKRVLHNKSMSIASDTDNSGSPFGSNRSSPSRHDYDGSFLSRHRNSFGSDCSTPPDSPCPILQHSTPYSDHTHASRNTGSTSRHAPTSIHSSDSSLEYLSAGSTDELHHASESRMTSRLAAPGFHSASASGGGLRTGLANSQGPSPQRSGLPTPRRGIPRPAMSPTVRSSLPMPRRSGIPSHRPPSNHGRDESWRDGCF
ncbi:SLAIN motif-containing protein 2-like [Babylonia areolata]|uniref:SLAIN motif-containing protein 2-like n=1 Tax=Babylonia areolata TaxID=304850 RepID=UPI003FD34A9C